MMHKGQLVSVMPYHCSPLCRLVSALMLGLTATTIMVLPASAAAVTGAANTSEQSVIAADNANSSAVGIRQDLVRIITSADYAESKAIKSWQRIEKPASTKEREPNWLVKLLKWLFGSQGDSGMAAFFSLLLKGLLILALFAFIIWVARRAGYLQGWVGTMQSRLSRSSRIEPYNPESLSQRWQALPEHDQIPAAVAEYLQQGELTAAASILYRGSLRWLMLSKQLTIAPAMTEKQCLAQIKQLNESGQHHYISGIIQLWVQAAYNSAANIASGSTPASPNSAHNAVNLATQLREVSTHWLDELPSFDNTRNHKASHSADKTAEVENAE